MNNVFVYIEMEGGKVADVSLELLTKGRELATTLGVKLEAVVLGENLAGIEQELARYGGWDYEYVGYNLGWAKLQEMLDHGEIDILTSARRTPGRRA